jgi:Zn-dependent protease with chaperone function
LVFGNVIDIRYILFYFIIEIKVLLWIISKEMRYRRKCEMKADSLAVDFVNPDMYAKALKHLDMINMIPDKFNERERRYLSHPALEERINNQRS